MEGPAGHVWLHTGSDVSVIPAITPSALDELRPAVIHATVNTPGVGVLVASRHPTVMADDYAPSVRTDIMLINASGPVDRVRIRAGALRTRHRFDDIARRATGFQANGYASFEHYQRLHPLALRYFDHRILRADVREARSRTLSRDRPVHIAYSGRLEEIKGVRHLPGLARELVRRGIDFRMSVFGAGPLARLIGESPNTTLHGHVDFETTWKEHMSHVDVMLFPHLQGDSSSTYYEGMGLGVPALGFSNATLTPLLRDGGGGWEVPRGAVGRMVDIIESVISNPVLLTEQSTRAIHYMSQYPMEQVFDERVDDFRRAAGVGAA
ncbi:MAG: glycosyltransferase [Microbacterium sp.]